MEARSVVKRNPAEEQANSLMERGAALQPVKTRGEYDGLVAFLREVKTGLKVVEDHHRPMYDKAKAALESVREAWDKYRKPLLALESKGKALGSEYLRAEARERERREAELLAAERKKQEKARDRQAVKLEKSGETEQAAAVRAAPVNVAPAVLERPKAEGAAGVEHWKHRITNADMVPREWCDPSDKRIGAYVRSVHEKASIPGVEVYKEVGMAVKAYED